MPIETVRDLKLSRLHQLSHLLQKIRDRKLDFHFGSAFYYVLDKNMRFRQYVHIRSCYSILMDCPIRNIVYLNDDVQTLFSNVAIQPDCQP